jgi:DNA invertase Pin-like site-specific DNA recombinase
MKTVAYVRVSSSKQDFESQKMAVLSFAQKERFIIDHFIEDIISTKKRKQENNFRDLVDSLQTGDTLIVSELSRVGRTLGVIIKQVDNIISRKINLIAIKENIKIIDGKQDIQTKMMISMFGLFAEIERDLNSIRTKEGLEKAKKKGVTLGRPKGKRGKSKLDGKEQEIAMYLDKKVSKASIARILDVSVTGLNHFIKTRNLEAGALLKETL